MFACHLYPSSTSPGVRATAQTAYWARRRACWCLFPLRRFFAADQRRVRLEKATHGEKAPARAAPSPIGGLGNCSHSSPCGTWVNMIGKHQSHKRLTTPRGAILGDRDRIVVRFEHQSSLEMAQRLQEPQVVYGLTHRTVRACTRGHRKKGKVYRHSGGSRAAPAALPRHRRTW